MSHTFDHCGCLFKRIVSLTDNSVIKPQVFIMYFHIHQYSSATPKTLILIKNQFQLCRIKVSVLTHFLLFGC